MMMMMMVAVMFSPVFWMWCHTPQYRQQPHPPEQRWPIGRQLQKHDNRKHSLRI